VAAAHRPGCERHPLHAGSPALSDRYRGRGVHLWENTTTAALGPANYRIDPATKKRVRAVQPITVGNSILYVQRAGRKLQSLDYQIQNDSFVSTDLAVLSDLMTRTGIIDMAYQGNLIRSSGAC